MRTGRASSIAHVDMDAFYAAVEQRDRPDLRGRPVIVGGDPRGRGVVSAASYEARPFGVRSAMPISRAARLCPHAVFLPVDMEKYQRVSTRIMAILAEFSPLVEQISVDEAFIDLTGTGSLFGAPIEAIRQIKGRILTEVGLTASAGLASNKFVAKVASDLRKPDGLVVVPAGDEARFLAPLPVERLWGAGGVTTRELHTLGLRTIGQLQALPREPLMRRFGALGEHLHRLAFGLDPRPVAPEGSAKSMGAEETFSRDCRDLRRLGAVLRAQAERVSAELRRGGVAASCVTLKLRFADFHTLTRSWTAEPTQDGLEIYRRAAILLERIELSKPARLIGVSASQLVAEGQGQLSLLDVNAVRRERLARVVDGLTRRFGDGAVRPASLLDHADQVPAAPSRRHSE
jgi:DNA polymerase IV